MRPIKLKIKGLNSFTETQEINFKKLTRNGLFGIFGPTGSGKSTILDGITLALYGEIARKSTNFINTNCDSLNVSFEFQISDKNIKLYRVDREFKRDSKTGSVRSRSARVMDITDEHEVILEDRPKNVTSKCEEIIGLKLEDFMRTVVLPQGKFSEFLKLEGKERRDMLERLFNLQIYGDELSAKLGNRIKSEREKSNMLDGELKSYEDVNDEIFEEKRQEMIIVEEQYANCEKELRDVETKFTEGKELWELQNECRLQVEEINVLKNKEKYIEEVQNNIRFWESVLKVKPYIDSYDSTLMQMNEIVNELEALTKNAQILKSEKEKTEIIFENISKRKDNEIPELMLRKQMICDCIEEKHVLNKITAERNHLMEDITKINVLIDNVSIEIHKNNENIKSITDNIESKEKHSEQLSISEEFKRKVNEGLFILNDYENIISQGKKLSEDIEKILLDICEGKRKNNLLTEGVLEKEVNLKNYNSLLNKLVEECPGDQNTLLYMQQKLSIIKEKWDKYNECSETVGSSRKQIENINVQLLAKTKEKTYLEQQIKEINESINKIENENTASKLRASLSDGQPCPVCGSKHHCIELIDNVDLQDLENLKSNIMNKEVTLSKLINEINKLQVNLEIEEKTLCDNENKLENMGEDFKNESVTIIQNEFEKKKSDIEEYNLQKHQYEKTIKLLTEEKNTLDIELGKENTKLYHNNEQLDKLRADLLIKDDEFTKTERNFMELKTDLNIEDFKTMNDEVIKKVEMKNNLLKEIKLLRINLNNFQDLKEELNKKSLLLTEELSEKNAIVFEKNKNIEEKNNIIKTKAGDSEDLEQLLTEISYEINEIEKDFLILQQSKKETDKQFNELNNKIISLQSSFISVEKRSIDDKEKLEVLLKEEGIIDVESARNGFDNIKNIGKLKLEVQEYWESLQKLSGALESLKKKINDRNITEEYWIEIQTLKNNTAIKLKELTEKNINLKTAVTNMKDRLLKKQHILNKKQELDYKLGLLDDLEKLFKGKKFVEFVAANQLKYVAAEAGKKLKEITAGNYGLETDKNGKFLIRDYKNGGAERDVSTLSGGETFLTSLALALSLSSQIQLKGTAPLELFFLDEGFGTLDENLLDIVMDSLEKIHNDKLSIGIISHLETIKNRMPVKLIVTPSVAGIGGSKVSIETN